MCTSCRGESRTKNGQLELKHISLPLDVGHVLSEIDLKRGRKLHSLIVPNFFKEWMIFPRTHENWVQHSMGMRARNLAFPRTRMLV